MIKLYSTFTFVSLLLAIYYFYPTQSAVIGLDLGSEYMKISSISPGRSFYIVEDTTTKRKTPTSLGFYNNERILEYDTSVKRPKAYQTTFNNLPRFFGKSHNDPKVAQHLEAYLEDYILSENERGTLSFGLKNFKMSGDEDEQSYNLKIEEIAGMVFRHIKRLSEKQAERQLRDVVVAIPPYWTFKERYALNDALLLADLNPLAFMSENTAAALYYALERQDNDTHTVIFYNMGSTSIKVSLVEFYLQKSVDKVDKGAMVESFRVLADAWDEDLGGLNFDVNLVKHFAKEFDSKPARAGKKSVLTSLPARAKLLKEANRLKEILSANKQAQIYLENLFESTDFKLMVERNTFEELNSELFEKLTKPIDEALKKAGKTVKDIDAIELLGGGIRVPKLQQVLNEYLKEKEVSTHLNGDESMALGAAFHAANLSASFKTRQLYVNDGYGFDIRVELKDLEPSKSEEGLNKTAVLFPEKTRFGSKKILAFDHDGDVNSTFYARLPGQENEEVVISFAITGLKEAQQDAKFKDKDLGTPKIHLHYRLSPLGFIELNKAEATIEEIVLYEDTKTGNTTETDKATTSESTSDDTEQTGANQDTEATSQDTETNIDSSADTSGEAGSTDDATADSEKKFRRKTITHHVALKIQVQIPPPGPMSEEELEKARDLLSKFDHYEEQKKKTAEAKNRLEAYLYSTRDYLEEDSFAGSAKEEEREQLKSMLLEHDEWLYSDEASKSNHLPFHKRYEDMHKIMSKIHNRIDQRLKRPEIIEKAKETLTDLVSKAHDLNTTKPWITEEATHNVVKQIHEISMWLDEMITSQEKLEAHEDPVLTIGAINVKIDRAKDLFNRLKNTAKPKAPKNGTEGADSEGAKFDFNGKDGKFDDAAFKEYLKKMNITFDGNKFRTEGEEGKEEDPSETDAEKQAPTDETSEQTNDGGSSQEETKQETPKEESKPEEPPKEPKKKRPIADEL